MKQESLTPLKIRAPAKINLFLHILGRDNQNYHQLQSLITFASLEDSIEISSADKFCFSIKSNIGNVPEGDKNIVTRAANLLAKKLNQPLNLYIHLTKNIPIGAGLGGGSADAAATIKGLLSFWKKKLPPLELQDILVNLGADVPMCYYAKACIVEGIGEKITPIKIPSQIPALLIFPNKFCSTADIFNSYNSKYTPPINITDNLSNQSELYKFLKKQKNDLTSSASQKIPEITHVLQTLKNLNGCYIARMSGSGSACFGLFETQEQTKFAASVLEKEKPDWKIWPVLLGEENPYCWLRV